MNYSDESLEAEQMSNSKSEDTPTHGYICKYCSRRNDISEPPQDTSLDELIKDLRTENSNSFWQEYCDEAEAKINRLIVEAKLEGFDIAFDCHDYDRLRAYKEELTKELGDSEAEKNSGTWSRV